MAQKLCAKLRAWKSIVAIGGIALLIGLAGGYTLRGMTPSATYRSPPSPSAWAQCNSIGGFGNLDEGGFCPEQFTYLEGIVKVKGGVPYTIEFWPQLPLEIQTTNVHEFLFGSGTYAYALYLAVSSTYNNTRGGHLVLNGTSILTGATLAITYEVIIDYYTNSTMQSCAPQPRTIHPGATTFSWQTFSC